VETSQATQGPSISGGKKIFLKVIFSLRLENKIILKKKKKNPKQLRIKKYHDFSAGKARP
jgi:hypothetical protein